jgi:hypothetical protein
VLFSLSAFDLVLSAFPVSAFEFVLSAFQHFSISAFALLIC